MKTRNWIPVVQKKKKTKTKDFNFIKKKKFNWNQRSYFTQKFINKQIKIGTEGLA